MVKTSRPEKWRTTYFRSDFWRPLPWRAKPDLGQHEGKNTEKHILRVNTLESNTYKKELDDESKKFLEIVRNNRSILVDRLRDLGLLSSFLAAENGTKQEP